MVVMILKNPFLQNFVPVLLKAAASPGPRWEGVEDLHGYNFRWDKCDIMQRKGEE